LEKSESGNNFTSSESQPSFLDEQGNKKKRMMRTHAINWEKATDSSEELDSEFIPPKLKKKNSHLLTSEYEAYSTSEMTLSRNEMVVSMDRKLVHNLPVEKRDPVKLHREIITKQKEKKSRFVV
jgi:hypothetical protein